MISKPPLVNRLRCITLVVEDAMASADRYRTAFGYELIDEGVIEAELAKSWSAGRSAGRRYTIVRAASGVRSDLRFIEGDPVAGYVPLRTFGWAAIELCVQDVLETARSLADGPFTIIGPPGAIAALPTIWPMQVRGPDQEIVFLTQILTRDARDRLPTAVVAVDRPFICVLACTDAKATAHWFEARFPVTISEPITIPYRMLNRSFDLPDGTLHTLFTAADHEIFLEIDQYPEGATVRSGQPEHLAPGTAICTLMADDLDAMPGPWLHGPVARPGPLYGGGRVGTMLTPEAALVEILEAPAGRAA